MRHLIIILLPLILLLGCETKPKKPKEPAYKKFGSNLKKSVQSKKSSRNFKVQSKNISYSLGKNKYTGYLAYPTTKEAHPGILLLPEHWGITKNMKTKAKQMARWGYTVLVVDFYGNQQNSNNPDKAVSLLNSFYKAKNNPIEIVMAAHKKLISKNTVNASQVAIVGFSFGGAVATDLMRKGYPFTAVVNVHGSVGSKNKAKPGAVKSKFLWLKGDSDFYIPKRMVSAFNDEMKSASSQIKVVTFKNTYNGFTNPLASRIGKKYQMPIKWDSEKNKEAMSNINNFLSRHL